MFLFRRNDRHKEKILNYFFSKNVIVRILKDKNLVKLLKEGFFCNGIFIYTKIDNLDYNFDGYEKLQDIFIKTIKENSGMFDSIVDNNFSAFFSEKLYCNEIFDSVRNSVHTLIEFYKKNKFNYNIGIGYGEVLILDMLSHQESLSFANGSASSEAIVLCAEAKNSVNVSDKLKNKLRF